MTDYRFDGKVALVTGSGGGLGRQHALELARRGAKVMINDIGRYGKPTAQRFAEGLLAEGLEAAFDTGSVAVEAEATALVEHTIETFGRIDILVNNAGAGGPGCAQDVTTSAFSETITLHLFGSLWTMRAALQHMRDQNYGRIINTSSALGAFGAKNSVSYVTAKAGIIGLTKSAALDNDDRDIGSTPSARSQQRRWRNRSSTPCRTSARNSYTSHASPLQCCSSPTKTAP